MLSSISPQPLLYRAEQPIFSFLSSEIEMDKVEDAGPHCTKKDSYSQLSYCDDESEGRQEHLYKVLVIGDYGVGKTSIIRRYTDDVFSPNYKLTIGVDFSLKTLLWSSQLKINLQLWDIAGHERFGHMTRVYYKYAIGAIIVFDLTRQVTFDSVAKWLRDVNEKVVLENGNLIPVVLLANKCDVEHPQVEQEKIDEFCSMHSNILGWYRSSAKEGTNISESMELLITKILKLYEDDPNIPVDVVDIGTTTANHQQNKYATENIYSGSLSRGMGSFTQVVGMQALADGSANIQTNKKDSRCCS